MRFPKDDSSKVCHRHLALVIAVQLAAAAQASTDGAVNEVQNEKPGPNNPNEHTQVLKEPIAADAKVLAEDPVGDEQDDGDNAVDEVPEEVRPRSAHNSNIERRNHILIGEQAVFESFLQVKNATAMEAIEQRLMKQQSR